MHIGLHLVKSSFVGEKFRYSQQGREKKAVGFVLLNLPLHPPERLGLCGKLQILAFPAGLCLRKRYAQMPQSLGGCYWGSIGTVDVFIALFFKEFDCEGFYGEF